MKTVVRYEGAECAYAGCDKAIGSGLALLYPGGELVHTGCGPGYEKELWKDGGDLSGPGETVRFEVRRARRGTGQVKFYGARGVDKTFGFITPDDGGPNIFFKDFDGPIERGDRVEVLYVQKSRKWRTAVDVRKIA
jgi:cold shock CspA family protein